jgi:hypothetical protein
MSKPRGDNSVASARFRLAALRDSTYKSATSAILNHSDGFVAIRSATTSMTCRRISVLNAASPDCITAIEEVICRTFGVADGSNWISPEVSMRSDTPKMLPSDRAAIHTVTGHLCALGQGTRRLRCLSGLRRISFGWLSRGRVIGPPAKLSTTRMGIVMPAKAGIDGGYGSRLSPE